MSYFSAPGIFNVLDPWLPGLRMIANDNSSITAENNAKVLQAIILIAQNATTSGCISGGPLALGATILFPGNSEVPGPVGPGPYLDQGAEYFIAIPSPLAPTNPNAAVLVPCYWPLRFLGTGNARITMVAGDNGFGDMFFVETAGSHDADIGGITFEDLRFRFVDSGDTSGVAAIHVPALGTNNAINDGGQNVRVIRCIFEDCPVGVWFENSLQAVIDDCTIVYDQIIGTAVQIGASNNHISAKPAHSIETHISNSTFRVSSGAPQGSTAMLVICAEHLRVSNVRMDGFSSGIVIAPKLGWNVVKCHFSNVSCYVGPTNDTDDIIGTALLIKTDDTEDNPTFISQLIFEGCEFEPGDSNMNAAGGTGGIIINEASGTTIENVRFVSCYSSRFPGAGMSITGGSDIEILGGMYSGNNLAGSAPANGIYATGTEGLRIIGVNCIGKYQWIVLSGSPTGSPRQDVGIYLDSSVANVLVSSCQATGNAVAGIHVEGGVSDVIIDSCDVSGDTVTVNGIVVNAATVAVSNVFIRNCNATGYSAYSSAIDVLTSGSNAHTVAVTDCAGYNDQAAGGTFSVLFNSPFHAYDRFYYGPATFYVPLNASTTNVKVGATNTGLTSGSFVLAPGVPGEIIGGSGAISIAIVGQ